MIEIISGTDRPGSNSLVIARLLVADYQAQQVDVGLIDLQQLSLVDAAGGVYFKGAQGSFQTAVDRVTRADGLVVVVPEYNGSFPGILKLFIDYWKYPDSFENRPIALVGLGAKWGGLRPVEHLQQVFGYRNAFIFPNRVFISNVKDSLKGGVVSDLVVNDLLKIQTRDFLKFIRALKDEQLDANSRLKR